MTDHRKRLERLASGERPMSVYPIRAVDPADDMLEITVFDALQHAADLRKLLAEGDRVREALIRLRDCDWVITPLDRMDAVRDIARQALTGKDG